MDSTSPASSTPPGSAARSNAPPSDAPAWITAELIRLTRIVWEPLYKAQLSVEEAVSILMSVGRLSGVLAGG